MDKIYHKKIDKKVFFYPKDFQMFLDKCNERQKITVLTLLNTGARINEARHITKGDLDEVRNNLKLRVTKIRAKLKETQPTPRDIPVSSAFMKFITKTMREYKITSDKCLPIHSTSAADKFIRRICNECKIKNANDYSSHNFRKTLGTWLLALNINGFKVAQYLGHTPNVLRTNYASADLFNAEDKKLIKEILDDLPTRMLGEN